MRETEISVFKLITGEEILAETRIRTADDMDVKNPVLVARVPTQDGKMNILLLPMAPFAETKEFFTIDRKHVVWQLSPVAEMKAQYEQMLGKTTILMPKKPELILG